MASHYEIKPDQRGLAMRIAQRALSVANGLSTARPGSVYIPNKGEDGFNDGTGTWIGSGGIGDGGVMPWVGDTIPPGKPTGVSATSAWGVVYATWDGTLEGGVPADFAYVSVSIDGTEAARLTEAGKVAAEGYADGQSVTVSFVAYDAARSPQTGQLAPNASPADTVTITVSDARGEIDKAVQDAEDKADALAQQVEQVETTVNGVQQDVTELTTQVSGAVDTANEALTAASTAQQDIDGFKTTVEQTYETKSDADAAMAQEVLDRNSAIEQSATSILSQVSEDYVSNETGATYATKTELQQESDNILLQASETYQVKGDYATTDEAAILIDTGEASVAQAGENAGMQPYEVDVYGNTEQEVPGDSPIYGVEPTALVTAGKNLWTNPSGTNGGVTVTSNDDGTTAVSGTSSGGSTVQTSKIYALAPSKSYRLTIDKAMQNGYFDIREFDSSGSAVGVAHVATVDGTVFDTEASMSYVLMRFIGISGASFSGTYRVMLNEGETAEPWEPPAVTETPIDMQGHALYSLPDGARDVLTADSAGALTIAQAIGDIASYNGENVGTEWVASALTADGTPATGAHVIYKLSEPQTVDLGTIDLPALPASSANVWAVSDISATVHMLYYGTNAKALNTYATKAELKVASDSITSTVSEVSQTADEALTKASTVEQTVDGVQITLTDTTKTANDAKTAAQAAQSSADAASTAAGNAQSTANSAASAASTAQSAAEAAQTAADAAQSDADTAQQTATDAAKTATNYLSFSSDGLVVGDQTGTSLGNNVLIDSDSVEIRSGSEVISSFGKNVIVIGVDSDSSKIGLCGNRGTIESKNDGGGTSYSNSLTISSGNISLEEVSGISSVGVTGGDHTVTINGYYIYVRDNLANRSKTVPMEDLIDALTGLSAYPVGSVYISYVSTSPASLFGGTWTEITGRFPYFNHGTAPGGSNTHTHTLGAGYAQFSDSGYGDGNATMLAGRKSASWSNSDGWLMQWVGGQFNRFNHGTIGTQSIGTPLGGSTDSGNNMPAYQTLYAWRRTA